LLGLDCQIQAQSGDLTIPLEQFSITETALSFYQKALDIAEEKVAIARVGVPNSG
jgi:hypothetical protein